MPATRTLRASDPRTARIAAASCFAGLVLLVPAPTSKAGDVVARGAPSRIELPGASRLRLASAAIGSASVIVRVTPFDLRRLEPKAFADWEPSQD